MTPVRTPQLEAFEDRTAPAVLGLALGVEVAALAHVEVVATVEIAPDKSSHLFKEWLKEESLYADGPGHSENAPGQQKKHEKLELSNQGTLPRVDETPTAIITIRIRPKDREVPSRVSVAAEKGEEPTLHILPIEIREPAREAARVHPGWHRIYAPVPEESAVLTSATPEAARPLQTGEIRPTGSPLLIARPATIVPAAIAAGEIATDSATDAAPAPEVVVDATPATAEPPAAPATNWTPAIAQVAEVISRFVPLDAGAVEESVDQFLSQLRDATGFELSPRTAGLLTAALVAGVASGEFARRKQLPQRVTQFLSRIKHGDS